MLSLGNVLLLPILLRASLVSTAPTLTFPINSQVPPVARIGELFSFVFSASTFTSPSGSSLSYSLVDPPSWLSVDSDSQRLYGTPQDSDIALGTVVGVNVTLVATDSTGSTPDDATLVVSRSPGPSVQVPISDQIQGFGHYSEPSALLYYPAASFSFAFASDTFADPDAASLNYYPVMADNSPLPAWISFDAGNLAFAGTTPPFDSLIEPPQNFAMKLVASDVIGFSAAEVDFSIVVGSHALTTDQPDITLNATAGEELNYDGLASGVQLDGQSADPSNVNLTADNMPSWLSLDPTSWAISGTPQDDAVATTFTVVVKDAYEDKLNITFDVRVASNDSFFQGAFPSLIAHAGEQMSFSLGFYLVNPSGVDTTVDIQPATSWILWDASSLTLSGEVPNSVSDSTIDVMFTVDSKSSTKLKRTTSQSQKLTIEVESVSETTSPSATTSSTPTSSKTTAATSTSTSTSSPPSSTSKTGARPWTIVAIVISTIAGLALIIWLCLCCRKRKNKRHSQSILNNDRSGPPSDTLIHTPGHAVGSPDLQSSVSPNEKGRAAKALKVRNLFADLTPPPSRRPEDVGSVTTTPGSGLRLGWFSSLRSFRVVNMRRVGRPHVNSIFYNSEYGSSHHDLDLDFGFQSSPLPPVLNLPQYYETRSDVSFEEDVQQNLPPVARSSRRLSKAGNTNTSLLPIPGAPSIRLVEKDPFTDTPPRPRANERAISPIDERDGDSNTPQSVSHLDSNGPHSAPARHRGHGIALTTPPSTSTGGPSSLLASSSLLPTSVQPPRRATTMPIESYPPSPSRRPTPVLGSQRSSASNASSTDTMRARARRHKLTAKAKGALFVALQSPKRRTLAALGKKHSSGSRTGFFISPRGKKRAQAQQRVVLESVDCDSTSVLNGRLSESRSPRGDGGGGIAGFLSPRVWPQPAANGSGNANGNDGAANKGHPALNGSPKPTPKIGTDSVAEYESGSESENVIRHPKRRRGGATDGERASNRSSLRTLGFPPPPPRCSLPPIRRRPVPPGARISAGSASASGSASNSNSSDHRSSFLSGHLSFPSPVAMPSPLRTPSRALLLGDAVRNSAFPFGGSPSASSPGPGAGAGLGITNTTGPTLYEDVANSSPYDNKTRETSWATSASCGGTIIDRERERRGSLGVSSGPRGSVGGGGGGWASAPPTVSNGGARRFDFAHYEVDESPLLPGGGEGAGVGVGTGVGGEEQRYSGRSSSESGVGVSVGVGGGGGGGGRAFV